MSDKMEPDSSMVVSLEECVGKNKMKVRQVTAYSSKK